VLNDLVWLGRWICVFIWIPAVPRAQVAIDNTGGQATPLPEVTNGAGPAVAASVTATGFPATGASP
jgi:hypothetical protein